ncbi:MAG: glycosyltransferase family 4 protein [Chloroflexi bacterium]|nr:glycosyltransferase family 4 protein [Chloroflexota bacterium]
MTSRTIDVAFTPLGTNWQGGRTLVMNAIRALRLARSTEAHVRILGSDSQGSSEYARAAGADGVVMYEAPPRWSLERVRNALGVRLGKHNASLGSTLERAGVQVLVGESVNWHLGNVATIGWLQDFQHVHLPALFSPTETALRDRKFQQTMRLADRLFASPCCAEDARKFAPEFSHKLRPIRPYSSIDTRLYERDCRSVVTRFGLPERFLYVPNQFWTHKNHLGLLEALRILRGRGVRPHVVFTGSTHDYRDPEHFPSLQARIREWELTDWVHYLGIVEHEVVYDLIRQSLCVVNPSLFEGWGFSVDEAAAIGKRILSSDIPAHRDQQAPACEYFDPRSVDEIADKIEQVWLSAAPGPDLTLEARARQCMPRRIDELAQSLLSGLQEAVSAHAAQ